MRWVDKYKSTNNITQKKRLYIRHCYIIPIIPFISQTFISYIIRYYCISSCDTGEVDLELCGDGSGVGEVDLELCGDGSGVGLCLILNRRISSRQAARTTGSLINASIPIDGNRLASSLDIVY